MRKFFVKRKHANTEAMFPRKRPAVTKHNKTTEPSLRKRLGVTMTNNANTTYEAFHRRRLVICFAHFVPNSVKALSHS